MSKPKTKTTANTEQPLLQIMYSSVSQEAQTEQMLENLFALCQRNNSRDGITGALMCSGRLNIQFLEGPQDKVLDLWQRIQNDLTHHSVVQLHSSITLQGRLFNDWAMLRGQSSRQEMLDLVRGAYLKAEQLGSPAWALGIGPLLILLDGEFRGAYARALNEDS